MSNKILICGFPHCEKTFDIICPLGEECYTAGSIDNKFNKRDDIIRSNAFPFDYVGHSYIEQITAKINDLYTILKKENLDICNFNNKYYFVDKKFKFKYWHDTTYDNPTLFTEDDINLFLNKYNKRYDRLIQIIKLKKRILFISVNHFDNIYNDIYKKQEILVLYNLLYNLNNNITLLAFNFDNSNYTENNLIHIKLDHDKNVPFEQSKIDFSQKLFNYVNDNIKLGPEIEILEPEIEILEPEIEILEPEK
jgi:hypothetical protein